MTEPSPVYFAPLPDRAGPEALGRAAARVFEACCAPGVIAKRDFVALKLHVGERGNDTFVPPGVFRVLGEKIRSRGGRPFLTETSTLYRGERQNAVQHILHAHRHGFSIEATGLPFIPADGLAGNTEMEVAIPGELNTAVKIAREVLVADALVAVAHMTGHLASGFGGVIKTLGMGLASRMGKMRQHSSAQPRVDPAACTFCRKCLQWCPVEAVVEKSGKAFIRQEKCIGCGECVAVCRFDAVRYNWGMETDTLEKHMAEHALGVVQNKRGKCVFLDVAVNLTKDCDCMDFRQQPVLPDVGVLASQDPVAVDQACLDLVRRRHGRDLDEVSYPGVSRRVQISHGEAIGLGQRRYALQTLDGEV